eukprot:COSAG03_NODE_1537_length_3911_cov_1.417891_1_plen_213_part_00
MPQLGGNLPLEIVVLAYNLPLVLLNLLSLIKKILIAVTLFNLSQDNVLQYVQVLQFNVVFQDAGKRNNSVRVARAILYQCAAILRYVLADNATLQYMQPAPERSAWPFCASAYARGPSCCTVYGGRFDWRSPLAVPVHVQISIIGPARPAHRTRARQSFSTSNLSTSAHESASWDLSEDRSHPRPASSVYCANCLPENRVTTHRAVDTSTLE